MEPRAPMAIPTSARARAGASLIPSPVMMTGTRRCSRRTTSSLRSGVSPARTSSTPASAPTAAAASARSPVARTMRVTPPRRMARDRRPGVRPDPVLEHDGAGGLAVCRDEHGERAVQSGPPADFRDPRGIPRHFGPRGAPEPDRAAPDRPGDALAGTSSTASGRTSRQSRSAGTAWPPPGPRPPAPRRPPPRPSRPQPGSAARTTSHTGRPAGRTAPETVPPRPPGGRCPRRCCQQRSSWRAGRPAPPTFSAPLRTGSPGRARSPGLPAQRGLVKDRAVGAHGTVHRQHITGRHQ